LRLGLIESIPVELGVVTKLEVMKPPPEPAAPLAPRLASWREPEAGPALVAQLRQRGRDAGLAAVGIAPAVPMAEARLALEERKAAGLDGGMQFTYRNPDRSTDPARVLAGARSLVVGAWGYRRRDPVGEPRRRRSRLPAGHDDDSRQPCRRKPPAALPARRQMVPRPVRDFFRR